MGVVGYSAFRRHLFQNLDSVNFGKEIVVVSRTHGKNAVPIGMDEYKAILGTLHLASNKANRIRLEEAMKKWIKGYLLNIILLKNKWTWRGKRMHGKITLKKASFITGKNRGRSNGHQHIKVINTPFSSHSYRD